LGNGDVARIFRVGVERSSVAECNKQTRIVRPRRSDDVMAHFQLDDSGNVGEPAEALVMLCAPAKSNAGLYLKQTM
jgi:hypothetical protein